MTIPPPMPVVELGAEVLEYYDAVDDRRVALDYVHAAAVASAWRNDGRRRKWKYNAARRRADNVWLNRMVHKANQRRRTVTVTAKVTW